MQAFISDAVYTAGAFKRLAVLEDAGVILDLVPHDDVPQDAEHIHCPHALIPAFTDLQINGCGGALLNRDMSMEALQTMHDASLQTGVTSIYPTLITCPDEQIIEGLALMEKALMEKERMPALEGLHLEGPFIGTTNNGTHPIRLIRPLDEGMLQTLCEYAEKGVLKIITVAPENVPPQYIRRLVEHGVVVSLGHSNASVEQVRKAVEAGASLVTHLYNGMPLLAGREPSVVGAAFMLEGLHASIIADFVHVSADGLRIAKAIMGRRLFAVTDATATGSHETHLVLNDEVCSIENSVIRNTHSGSLAGSAITMDRTYENLMQLFGVEEAIEMCSSIPADVVYNKNLGTKNYKKGRIAKDHAANFLCVQHDDTQFCIKDVVLFGKSQTKHSMV